MRPSTAADCADVAAFRQHRCRAAFARRSSPVCGATLQPDSDCQPQFLEAMFWRPTLCRQAQRHLESIPKIDGREHEDYVRRVLARTR